MSAIDSVVVQQQLAIRRPAADVFAAFADPEITTQFWFNRSSGPLTESATVTWFFDVFDVAAEVRVLDYAPDTRIRFEWGTRGGDGSDATTVDFTFEAKAPDRTLVTVVNEGFKGDEASILATALDSMGGFSLVLGAAKAWLEHGVNLKIVEDKF